MDATAWAVIGVGVTILVAIAPATGTCKAQVDRQSE